MPSPKRQKERKKNKTKQTHFTNIDDIIVGVGNERRIKIGPWMTPEKAFNSTRYCNCLEDYCPVPADQPVKLEMDRMAIDVTV